LNIVIKSIAILKSGLAELSFESDAKT